MAYHDDLLQHAIFLSKLNLPDQPRQADLRRAVSAAYYAVFHLLTTEAALNWKHPAQRHRFARMFDHGPMKNCSSDVVSRRLPDNDRAAMLVTRDLRLVASSFCKLQQAREVADYDNSKVWSRMEAYEIIDLAQDAMAA